MLGVIRVPLEREPQYARHQLTDALPCILISMRELFAVSVRLRTYRCANVFAGSLCVCVHTARGRLNETACVAGVQSVATMSSSGFICSRRTIQCRTNFSPHCLQQTTSACCPSLSWWPYLSAGALRIGRRAGIRVFPHHQHRFAALRHARRVLGGDRGGRQRGRGGHCAVHGRRNHAEPRGGAKRGPRLSAQGKRAEKGIRPRRGAAASCCCATPRR